MNIRHKFILGAIAAATLAASNAFAQPQGPATGRQDCQAGSSRSGHGHGHGMMGHKRGGSHMSGNPAAMVAGRLAALKVELKITREQESAWEKFTTKASQQAETMSARREKARTQMSADVPAPERLAQRTEIAKQRIANLETMTVAVKDLYGTLTPEQKKIADQLLARGPMGGFGGGHGHGRG
jgi:Spy/CpxP family protein refolding chaperone